MTKSLFAVYRALSCLFFLLQAQYTRRFIEALRQAIGGWHWLAEAATMGIPQMENR